VANSWALNCTGMAVNPGFSIGEDDILGMALPPGRLRVIIAQPLLFTELCPLRKLATSSKDGTHTVRALADGEEFARAEVSVTTLGQDFLRGASGGCAVEDFPREGLVTKVQWDQNQQNFVIAEVTLPSAIQLEGRVFDNPTARQSVPGAIVNIDGQSTQVGADGRFQRSFIAPFCPAKAVNISFPETSQNIYQVRTTEVSNAVIDFFATPVSAVPTAATVDVTPTLGTPGGPASITAPRENDIIKCPPLPQDCRFPVHGVASPSLGLPTSPYHVFVLSNHEEGKSYHNFLLFPLIQSLGHGWLKRKSVEGHLRQKKAMRLRSSYS